MIDQNNRRFVAQARRVTGKKYKANYHMVMWYIGRFLKPIKDYVHLHPQASSTWVAILAIPISIVALIVSILK